MRIQKTISRNEQLNVIISHVLPRADDDRSPIDMSAPSRKRVHSLLLCQVCYERFQLPDKAPKVLPCQHSFCTSCLDYLAATPTFNCPMCRKPQTVPDEGVHGFPTNLTIISLIDCYCTLCQNDDSLEQCSHCDKPICTECKEIHAEQMSDAALKKLQQLCSEKDTMECLCRDINKYAGVIKQFTGSAVERGNPAECPRQEVVVGLCRSLHAEVDSTTPLVRTAGELLTTIDDLIENGRSTADCDGSCTTCQLERKVASVCDTNCDGGCVPDKSKRNGSTWPKGCCDPPAAIKQLNRKLKDVRTITDALSQKSSILGKFSECYLRRQVSYLVSVRSSFTGTGKNINVASTEQELCRPSFVASQHEDDQFHVLDLGSNTVVTLDARGDELSRFGLDVTETGAREQYSGLTVSPEGDILVSDSSHGRICVYSESGEAEKHFGGYGSKPGQFKSPMGLDCDRQGHVHVSDWGNQRVQVLDVHGKFLRKYGETIAETDIFRPQFVHVANESGLVYVSDTQNSKIYIFGDYGRHVVRAIEGTLGSESHTGIPGLVWPAGVATIKYGYVLVLDWSEGCVYVLSPYGDHICTWGGPGEDVGQLNCPKGLAYCSRTSRVAVCDTANRRLQLLKV